MNFQGERLRFVPYCSVCTIRFIQHRLIQHVTHLQHIQIAFEIIFFSIHKFRRECYIHTYSFQNSYFFICYFYFNQLGLIQVSLVVQRSRILLPMQETLDPCIKKIPWRGKWQPTPVLLPGKSHGQRSLVGYTPWGHKTSDMTYQLNHNINSSWFTILYWFQVYSKVIQLYICQSFSNSFPIYFITEYWADFSVLYCRSLLVIYFRNSHVYMSIPNSAFIFPTHLSPLITINFIFYVCESVSVL